MRFSFTIEVNDLSEMTYITQALGSFTDQSGGVASSPAARAIAETMVQPDRSPPTEEPKPAKRGKPRLVEPPAPTQPVQPGNGNESSMALDDQSILKVVGDFCRAHPKQTPSITHLLRELGHDRITQLTTDQRPGFLARLQDLANDGPEAA